MMKEQIIIGILIFSIVQTIFSQQAKHLEMEINGLAKNAISGMDGYGGNKALGGSLMGGYGAAIHYRFHKYVGAKMAVNHTVSHQLFSYLHTGEKMFSSTRQWVHVIPAVYFTYPVKWFEPRVEIGVPCGIVTLREKAFNNGEKTASLSRNYGVFGVRGGISLYFYISPKFFLSTGINYNWMISRQFPNYRIWSESGFANTSIPSKGIGVNHTHMEVSVGFGFRIKQKS